MLNLFNPIVSWKLSVRPCPDAESKGVYLMIKQVGRFISVAAAVLCWYVILPVQSVLAAGRELNLDLTEDAQTVPPPSMLGLFFRLMVSLVIIVGLAYLVMRLMRKNMRVLSRAENIKVLDHHSFSLNKGVYITQIAGQVYVLGITDHNINLITEITDSETIERLVIQAREKDEEPIIPPSILEHIMPRLRKTVSGKSSFNVHIQKQIEKLQTMVGPHGNSREDDRDE